MTKFIFKGFYYPVFGSGVGWCGYGTKCITDKRFGGWDNYDKWWSFSYGIHCKLFNADKPYFQFVINKINENKELKIIKKYLGDDNEHFMFSVVDKKGNYVGDIRDGYFLSDYSSFRTYGEDNKQVCHAWSEKEQKAYGWSRRGKMGFGLYDVLFEECKPNGEPYEDDIPFSNHGHRVISTFEEAMESALNFAKYIS